MRSQIAKRAVAASLTSSSFIRDVVDNAARALTGDGVMHSRSISTGLQSERWSTSQTPAVPGYATHHDNQREQQRHQHQLQQQPMRLLRSKRREPRAEKPIAITSGATFPKMEEDIARLKQSPAEATPPAPDAAATAPAAAAATPPSTAATAPAAPTAEASGSLPATEVAQIQQRFEKTVHGVSVPISLAEPSLIEKQAAGKMSAIPEVFGRVHSIESFSAVDGPAIRSVVFLQGCLRRCVFCANPDTWSSLAKCQRMSSKAIAAKLKKNLSYYGGGGGVTLSGGEPMMQPAFCAAVFKEAHALGITTTIDTAGYGHAKEWAEVLPQTDMVLLCTKAMDPKLYFDMVQVKQKVMLDFATAVADYGVPMVLRFVLVPGLTDTQTEIDALVKWARDQPTLVGIEMLPYHRLGVNKWEALGIPYPLEGMEPPPKEEVDHWKQYLTDQGLKVML